MLNLYRLLTSYGNSMSVTFKDFKMSMTPYFKFATPTRYSQPLTIHVFNDSNLVPNMVVYCKMLSLRPTFLLPKCESSPTVLPFTVRLVWAVFSTGPPFRPINNCPHQIPPTQNPSYQISQIFSLILHIQIWNLVRANFFST